MSELRINWIALRNFKGLSSFTFDIGGADADVFARNAKGKTTLKDSFLWLLFGKNSEDSAKFSIKTLDENNEPVHGLEHEVEGAFTLDGKELTLRRLYKETYTKKRGSTRSEFTGHTTDYFVDNVPATEKEYKARVAEICDESVFRLLTDLSYFTGVMKWEQRRALLLEICGDVTDADVIASDPALAELPAILGDHTLEEQRKIIAARRTKINDEIKSVPVRIDETQRGLPEENESAADIESELKDLRTQAQEKHAERARLEAGGEVAEKTKQLRQAEADLIDIKNTIRAQQDSGAQEAEAGRRAMADKNDETTRQIRSKQHEVEANEQTITRLEKQMEALREAWRAIDAETFADSTETVCPACEQDLPAEKVDAAREKALAAFNSKKAKALEDNVAEGKQLKTQAGNIALMSEQLRKDIAALKVDREKLEAGLAVFAAPAPASVTDFSTYPEHESKVAQISALETEIEELQTAGTDALAAVNDSIRDTQERIQKHDGSLAAIEQRTAGLKRIDELKAQEEALAAEFEQLEKQLYLCDLFIKAKVALLTDRINSRFRVARFKLFETQINEGIKPCCEVLMEGVPFSDLNSAGRVQVAIDIISTLQEHYQFRAPLWIDNAETVIEVPAVDCQLIRLVVSAKDKKLRIETKTKETSNA
jgi:hypothetical protein